MKTVFENYFKELQSSPLADITEHTHRGALQELLKSITTDKKTKIIHEEKRSKEGFGAPDFTVRKTEAIVGYVENKKIEEDLNKTLKTDQIKKYRKLSDNILLTNYAEWIWIKGDDTIQRASLFHLTDLENKKFKLDDDNVKKVRAIIENFFSQAPKDIAKSKQLAEVLAIRAKNLKAFLLEDLKATKNDKKEIHGLYESFQENISKELKEEDFADSFAQMIAYSLFLARLNSKKEKITLRNAKDFIPNSYELIRDLVDFIEKLNTNKNYKNTRWILEEIISIVNFIDIESILLDLSFLKQTKLIDEKKELGEKDPYIYFYEDFLKAYDSKIRQRRGVYYTPQPVVSFITRAINDILKRDFKIAEGFGDRAVTVLDFATGTGTFLRDVIELILDEIPKNSGKKDKLIKEHILKNLYGFEYLIAPYTIAHLKLSQFLKEKEYTLEDDERFEIYFTNTLEPMNPQGNMLLPAISKEGREAQKIKDKNILVITGNPPYSGHSQNNGDWIKDLLKGKCNIKNIKTDNYYEVDGEPLGERNPKWLQDDYVKFIRFAQHKINETQEGVVGIITNHSFLDNPTFRGMRQSLMNSFDHIYFVDLHGNAKKKEKCLDGSKDDNVFDIEQGVCISIFVKKEGLDKKIYHTDFWGRRNDKYEQCKTHSIETIKWNELEPDKPFYLFIPQNTELREEYDKGYSVKDIFETTSVGVVTGKDKVLVGFNENELKNQIESHFKIDFDRELVEKISYRPFDNRSIYYDKKLVERDRNQVMKHMLQENMGLVTRRQSPSTGSYKYLFIINEMLADGCIRSDNKGGESLFPLYLYETKEEYNKRINKGNHQLNLLEPTEEYQPKRENFKPEFREYIDKKYNKTYTPEEILGYIYAVMHSPSYREKYLEFLKIDFPRIPFVDDKEQFEILSKLGSKLIKTHLLEETKIKHRYTGKGDDIVEKSGNKNDPFWTNDKLYINKNQYFAEVPKQVYEFQIGGYQVLEKYLKDRKDRTLSLDEIENIEKTIQALAFTIEQMQKINELTTDWV